MTVKTITVTKEAYDALHALKAPHESFTKTILRVAGRRPLSDFFGILKGTVGERFEKAILESRERRNAQHRKRLKKVFEAFGE